MGEAEQNLISNQNRTGFDNFFDGEWLMPQTSITVSPVKNIAFVLFGAVVKLIENFAVHFPYNSHSYFTTHASCQGLLQHKRRKVSSSLSI